MNIHQKINYRSGFAHQFAKNGVLVQAVVAYKKGYKNDFGRPHKDRRPNFKDKFHSVYPKK